MRADNWISLMVNPAFFGRGFGKNLNHEVVASVRVNANISIINHGQCVAALLSMPKSTT